MRFVVPIASIASVLLLATGCTCNRASESRRAQLQEQELQKKVVRRDVGNIMQRRRGRDGKAPIERKEVGVYFLDSAKHAAGEADPWTQVSRKVGAQRPVKNAVWMLFKGPTPSEAEAGLTLQNSGAEGFKGFSLEDGVVTLQLRGGCDAGGSTVTVYDHIVKTLETFPEVQHVKLLGPDGTTSAPDGPGHSRPACLEP